MPTKNKKTKKSNRVYRVPAFVEVARHRFREVREGKLDLSSGEPQLSLGGVDYVLDGGRWKKAKRPARLAKTMKPHVDASLSDAVTVALCVNGIVEVAYRGRVVNTIDAFAESSEQLAEAMTS